MNQQDSWRKELLLFLDKKVISINIIEDENFTDNETMFLLKSTVPIGINSFDTSGLKAMPVVLDDNKIYPTTCRSEYVLLTSNVQDEPYVIDEDCPLYWSGGGIATSISDAMNLIRFIANFKN